MNNNLPKALFLTIGGILLLNAVTLPLYMNFNVGLIPLMLYSIILIVYGLLFNKIRKSKIINIFIIVVSLILVSFGSFVAIYGNINTINGDENVIVVLGSGIRGEKVSENLANRLDVAVDCYEKNPELTIIVSGGKGAQEDISEAEAMKRYLISEGIPPQKVIKEDKATSTYENFVFSKEIIDEVFVEDSSICFITNDYHIFRAEKYALSLGMDVTHIGASTVWYSIPVNYMREILAVTKLFLTMILN